MKKYVSAYFTPNNRLMLNAMGSKSQEIMRSRDDGIAVGEENVFSFTIAYKITELRTRIG
jgi:hypothetical protein